MVGTSPFPRLKDRRADGALFAYQALLSRRDRDPGDSGTVDRLKALPSEQWATTLLRPEVFAFLADEPGVWTWHELASAIERPASVITTGELRVAVSPGDTFLRLLRRLGKGTRAESCAAASFLDPSSPAFTRASDNIAAASALLVEHVPGYAADIVNVVDRIALVDERASFRGSSGVIHRGLVFLSPEDDWTPGIYAEEILHEATHNLLDLLSLRTPLIEGDDVFEEKYTAPFRPDARHVYGNLHALIVVARLIHLFSRLESSSAASEIDWAERARDYAERSVEPLETVSAHPGLSPVARYLIDHLVRPTLRSYASVG